MEVIELDLCHNVIKGPHGDNDAGLAVLLARVARG